MTHRIELYMWEVVPGEKEGTWQVQTTSDDPNHKPIALVPGMLVGKRFLDKLVKDHNSIVSTSIK